MGASSSVTTPMGLSCAHVQAVTPWPTTAGLVQVVVFFCFNSVQSDEVRRSNKTEISKPNILPAWILHVLNRTKLRT